MKVGRSLLSAALLVMAVACLDTSEPASQGLLRLINASYQPLDVYIDNRLAITQSEQGLVSGITLFEGEHSITFRQPGDLLTSYNIFMAPPQMATVFVYGTGYGSPVAAVLLDSGVAMPAGKSGVRVTNLLADSTIDIYAKAPGATSASLVRAPYPYLTTNTYVQADSGSWEVYATNAGSPTPIATTGAFNVPSTGRRTALLLDSAGVPVFRLLVD